MRYFSAAPMILIGLGVSLIAQTYLIPIFGVALLLGYLASYFSDSQLLNPPIALNTGVVILSLLWWMFCAVTSHGIFKKKAWSRYCLMLLPVVAFLQTLAQRTDCWPTALEALAFLATLAISFWYLWDKRSVNEYYGRT